VIKAARVRSPLLLIYQQLDAAYGPQHWWPGDTPFEVMVGAILTQNTAWTNVERAIANLKHHDLLSPRAILEVDMAHLAAQVRPSGYFNVKAARLVHFCRWFVEHGEEAKLKRWSTEKLRNGLLGVKGIGAETADDILLYAFQRPVFVIDAYTRRIFSRLGFVEAKASYETMRHTFEHELGQDAALFNQYHALIVRHGKDVCRPRPACVSCAVRVQCAFAHDLTSRKVNCAPSSA